MLARARAVVCHWQGDVTIMAADCLAARKEPRGPAAAGNEKARSSPRWRKHCVEKGGEEGFFSTAEKEFVYRRSMHLGECLKKRSLKLGEMCGSADTLGGYGPRLGHVTLFTPSFHR